MSSEGCPVLLLGFFPFLLSLGVLWGVLYYGTLTKPKTLQSNLGQGEMVLNIYIIFFYYFPGLVLEKLAEDFCCF